MINDTKYLEAVEAYRKYGSYAAAGAFLNIDPRTVKNRIQAFYRDPDYSVAAKQAERVGADFNNVSHYWLKTKNKEGDDVSLFVKNNYPDTYEDMITFFQEKLINEAPSYDYIERVEYGLQENLAIIDPADLHIGKLAIPTETGDAEYNISVAIERAIEGVKTLVTRFDGQNVKHIAFVIGNDIIHTDNKRGLTTGGTPQDTSGQWWQMVAAAKMVYVHLIEYLATEYNVTVIYCPSNHDEHLGYLLADSIGSWFRNHPNVSFGQDNEFLTVRHRKYVQFGKNLIGFTHGDGAKEKDLPSLMQHEARGFWGECPYSYWYVHHYHHKMRTKYTVESVDKVEKDYTGVSVIGNSSAESGDSVDIEYVRSPSPADAWHAKKGYMSRAAIECFIHNAEHGQIARLTHFF